MAPVAPDSVSFFKIIPILKTPLFAAFEHLALKQEAEIYMRVHGPDCCNDEVFSSLNPLR